ncbi:MAG: hypothetical protein JW969_12165 [Spirochaetales bacterium]|nr:hypothetical protein [Spirochaetales bacterium]
MISYTDLKDILKITVAWEKKLTDLYDVAEFGLKNTQSKQIINQLKENHIERLSILENIQIEKYGRTEWMLHALGYKDEEIVPQKKITRESTPSDIAAQILDYEEKLKGFYQSIHDRLVTAAQKELFASLVKFKELQIENIKNIVSEYS